MVVLFVGSHRSDMQYSIVGFERALQRELQGRCDFQVVFPGSGATDWIPKGRRYYEKYVLFPRLLRQRAKKADIVHFCEKGSAVNLRHVQGKRTLVTVHDFLAIQAARDEFPGWQVSWTGRRYQKIILREVHRAKALACVSETTRKAVRIYLPEYQGQVRTILNGMYRTYSRVSREEALARLGPLAPKFERFFLHVGGSKPYKNREGAVRIAAEFFKRSPEKLGLVMAGGTPPDATRALGGQLGIADSVQWVVNPTDPQIEALYSLATAFLFPSFAEGFGLPVLEAQACGCPVFASNRAPMTEVGGDATVYYDPTEPTQAAEQILSHMDNLDELRALGFENVKRFDPKSMADQYMDYYASL